MRQKLNSKARGEKKGREEERPLGVRATDCCGQARPGQIAQKRNERQMKRQRVTV